MTAKKQDNTAMPNEPPETQTEQKPFERVRTLALDAKGRFALPVDFRRRIQGRDFFFFTAQTQNITHLFLYPEESRRKLTEQEGWSDDKMCLVTPVTMDEPQGRILIPSALRKQFGLVASEKISLFGCTDHFELANPDKAEDILKAREEEAGRELDL